MCTSAISPRLKTLRNLTRCIRFRTPNTWLVHSGLSSFVFETGTHWVDQAGLKHPEIPLPLWSRYGEDRHRSHTYPNKSPGMGCSRVNVSAGQLGGGGRQERGPCGAPSLLLQPVSTDLTWSPPDSELLQAVRPEYQDSHWQRKQEDQEFTASLSYMGSLRPAWAT